MAREDRFCGACGTHAPTSSDDDRAERVDRALRRAAKVLAALSVALLVAFVGAYLYLTAPAPTRAGSLGPAPASSPKP